MEKNPPIVVGITGYPGTGKSTLARILRLVKTPVQEADRVVAELFHRKEVISQVGREIPQAVKENKIDKTKLAEIVFQDPHKLEVLEGMIHPLVYQEHRRFIKDHQGQKLISLEIPLLFETGREKLCRYILYLTCQEEIARERVKKRGWSEKRYKATLNRLIPESIKLRKAHFIIDTSTSKVNTWHQVKDALQEICKIEGIRA
jgi:dephospho-CoA kinase